MTPSPCHRIIQGAARLAVLLLVFAAACRPGEKGRVGREAQIRPPVKPGIEVFLEKYAGLVKGKKVGLITNPSGVDSMLRSDLDLFASRPDFKLAALFGPEHGTHVSVQAGETVSYYADSRYGIPVFSLYRPDGRPASAAPKDRDAEMRSFDTRDEGKRPLPEMLAGIEVMVFDMQDVGTRVYTYIATMAYAMQACAADNIPFIVLDRPNPVGGRATEGPILEYPAHVSFIGVYPIPLRHGMTVGELAMLFNARFLETKVQLTVIPVENWTRGEWYDDTGLPWVMPSPNMPTIDTATVYPGQVMLEGTNVSEGRGTTRPFELFGAPWIDGFKLSRALDALALPGVVFREAAFTPTFSKFQGEPCGGCQLHVRDRNAYRPVETTLAVIKTIREMYPDKFLFHADYFDQVMGTAMVREALEGGRTVKDIVAGWQPGLRAFDKLRKSYLLYN